MTVLSQDLQTTVIYITVFKGYIVWILAGDTKAEVQPVQATAILKFIYPKSAQSQPDQNKSKKLITMYLKNTMSNLLFIKPNVTIYHDIKFSSCRLALSRGLYVSFAFFFLQIHNNTKCRKKMFFSTIGCLSAHHVNGKKSCQFWSHNCCVVWLVLCCSMVSDPFRPCQ